MRGFRACGRPHGSPSTPMGVIIAGAIWRLSQTAICSSSQPRRMPISLTMGLGFFSVSTMPPCSGWLP